MNRAETKISRSEDLVAIRSKSGTKVHVAYKNGGPTFCGLRFPARVVDAAQVADLRCCDKCYGSAI